jgi:hypothetical protein
MRLCPAQRTRKTKELRAHSCCNDTTCAGNWHVQQEALSLAAKRECNSRFHWPNVQEFTLTRAFLVHLCEGKHRLACATIYTCKGGTCMLTSFVMTFCFSYLLRMWRIALFSLSPGILRTRKDRTCHRKCLCRQDGKHGLEHCQRRRRDRNGDCARNHVQVTVLTTMYR